MRQRLIYLLLSAIMLLTGVNMQAEKKVHTLGDSTMAPYDESATNTRGWGMYFGNFLTNGWTSVNYARGGRDSRAGYNELWQNAKNNVVAGDYVLIQFAHNDTQFSGMDNLQLREYYSAKGDAENLSKVQTDGRGTIPASTYKENLKKIVDEVKAKGATPILVSAVCRCYFTNGAAPITRSGRHDIGGKFSVLTETGIKENQSVPESDRTWDYSYQMQQLAEAEGVTFIDMTQATKDLYESYGTYDKCYAALFEKGSEKDNTHYNLTGALTAARLCAQLIKQKGILEDVISIPTDLSCNPATADMGEVYVGQTATKELTLSGLGLEPASGTVSITATDGIQLSLDKQNWQTSLTANYENGTLIKTFYAKVNITAAGNFNGTITATTEAKNVGIPVTVKGIELGGGDPFTVKWALTSTNTPEISGTVQAADTKYENMGTYGLLNDYGALVAPGDGKTGGPWTAAIDDQNMYVQFAVTAPDGKKLDVNKIAMDIKAQGGGSLHCHVYYSTDGFVTRKTLLSSETLTGTVINVDEAVMAQIDEGEQLLIRVYPWSANDDASGRWICIKDVAVNGQVKDAAGVNIPGTITYKLDKGGLTQGNDAVMNPNELSAGFAGKVWTAGSALTVANTLSYQGASGEDKITQTRIKNETGSTISGTAGADNTLTLTLTPEDGFSFVPQRVSFEAARYGTDGGNISASIAAGSNEQQLVTNKGVNRSGNNLTIASFSEEVNGITATADNPLKLNFSFLSVGNGKEMGLSNVVITGTLVGAAAQVTKYALSTQIAPDTEAGSISKEPDLEMYKENSTVTLKATKNFGYKFVEWQDENGGTVSTDAETTITMNAAKTMKAVFEAVPVYTVKALVTNDADMDGMGSVTITPNEHDGKYEAGTKIQATANETKVVKFLSWTDQNENASATATRELTVNGDMTLVANYEVQDFIAVFDAGNTQSYAYATTAGYPFSADQTWDNQRNAKSSIVKVSDGSLLYTQDGGTPVVRNREGVVIAQINGLYQNGYHTADIAWQYEFSTVGFTSAKFVADMCAKNAATKQYKALISVGGGEFTELKAAWDVTANAVNSISIDLPESAIGQANVVIRITGSGDEVYNTGYAFDKTFNGMRYCDHSESGVGNVFVLGEAITEADEQAPVVTGTVPAANATGISATGKITISFDERIEAVAGAAAATLNGQSVEPTWSSRSVSFDYRGLEYGTQYTLQVPANYVQDKSGNKYAEAISLTFTTMERPTVTKALYDFIVPDNGTITEALDAANNRTDKNTRFRIFIKNSDTPYVFDTHGTTTGGDDKTYPDPRSYLRAKNTSFIGESIDGVVITNQTPEATWNNGYGAACPLEGIGSGDVLIIENGANDSYFQNLTIKSSMGDSHGRDIALQDKSTNTIFKDAALWAYQDTYVSRGGKYYFEGGVIRGRTDFICGSGDAYFNGVDIIMCEKGGYIVAPQDNNAYGYVFKDCTIKGGASDVDGNYNLGRPWTAAAETYFINTTMEVKPRVVGWSDWNNGATRFAEYGSTTAAGVAIDLSGRATKITGVDNNPILTEAEANTIGLMSNSLGDWQPTLATEQAPVPTNLKAEGTQLTWDDNAYALCWAICKDGKVVAFSNTNSFDLATLATTAAESTARTRADGSAEYSVRAANEMGGLSQPSASVTVADATGITEVVSQEKTADDGNTYSLSGQRVDSSYRGVVIAGGKKYVRK